MTETTIREHWCDRLWQRKGYDSPDEFMEPGNCFACGLDDGDDLQQRDDTTHLLCNYCHDDSKRLNGFGYLRWFLRRTATDTIAAAMQRRVASVLHK